MLHRLTENTAEYERSGEFVRPHNYFLCVSLFLLNPRINPELTRVRTNVLEC